MLSHREGENVKLRLTTPEGVNLGEEKSSNSTAIIAQLSISNEIRDGTWGGEGLSAGARWFAETGGMGVVRVR